jgi:hypothetical protein
MLVLILGGVLLWRLWKTGNFKDIPLPTLAVPMLTMFVLSIGPVYWPLAQFPILSAERVSSRFILLPFLFLILFVVISYQRWLQECIQKSWKSLLLFLPLSLIAADLLQHSRAWRIPATSQAFSQNSLNLSIEISKHSDPMYLDLLNWTSILSAASIIVWLIVLIFCNIRPKLNRKNAKS